MCFNGLLIAGADFFWFGCFARVLSWLWWLVSLWWCCFLRWFDCDCWLSFSCAFCLPVRVLFGDLLNSVDCYVSYYFVLVWIGVC